jgi:type IV pilus assembly protein PilC
MGRIKDILNTELFGTKKKKRNKKDRIKRRRRNAALQVNFLKIFMLLFGPFGILFLVTEYQKIKGRRLLAIYRTLRMIIENNAQLSAGLIAVSDDAPSSYVRSILSQLGEEMQEGTSLSESLELYPSVFSPVHIDLIELAEENGQLVPTLNNIIQDIETRELKRGVSMGNLTYILTCLFMQIAIMSFLLVRVVPVFAEIFGDFGAPLPWYSQSFIDFSQFISAHASDISIGIFVMTASCIIGYFLIHRSKILHGLWFRLLLIVPFVGQLVKLKQRLLVVEGLEIHLKAHLPLAEAIKRVSAIGIGPPFRNALRSTHEKLNAGRTALDSFPRRSILFGSTFGTVLSLGESAGTLRESCTRLRGLYRNELTRKSSLYADALIPAYALFGGALNLWFMLAIYSAIWGLSDVLVDTL